MKFAYTMLLILVTLCFISGCSEEKPEIYKSKNTVRKAVKKPDRKTVEREITRKETANIVNRDIDRGGTQEAFDTQESDKGISKEIPEAQETGKAVSQEIPEAQETDKRIDQETQESQDTGKGISLKTTEAQTTGKAVSQAIPEVQETGKADSQETTEVKETGKADSQETPESQNIDREISQKPPESRNIPKEETNIYITKDGDNLLAVAGKADIYNNSLKWPLLYRENPGVLSSIKDKYNFYATGLPAGKKLKIISREERETTLKDRPAEYYVVNLISSPYMKEIAPPVVKLIDAGYSVYISSTMIDGREWYRLRAGFYKTRSEANKEGNDIKTLLKIPDIWTVKVKDEEYRDFGGY